jgi:hypothetical protein
MLLELAITGIVGLVAWRMYGPSKTSTIADALNSYTDNGYQFRDVTYADKLEFWHPDVKNNHYYFNSNQIAHDRGGGSGHCEWKFGQHRHTPSCFNGTFLHVTLWIAYREQFV